MRWVRLGTTTPSPRFSDVLVHDLVPRVPGDGQTNNCATFAPLSLRASPAFVQGSLTQFLLGKIACLWRR